MNKKGFAVSGIIYTILLIFVLFLTMMLYNLQDRKTILDEIKTDAVKAVEEENTLESLQARIELLEDDVKLFIKTHPVGSVYVTVATDEATAEMMNTKYEGSTWEAYGEGRVLMGVGNNGTSSYNTVGSKGGSESNSTTLTEANLPSHSHSFTPTGTIKSTFTGTRAATESAGDHTHNAYIAKRYTLDTTSGGYASGASTISGSVQDSNVVASAGAHAHYYTPSGTVSSTFTGTAGTTGAKGSGTAFKTSTLQPYVTVYMYRRTA